MLRPNIQRLVKDISERTGLNEEQIKSDARRILLGQDDEDVWQRWREIFGVEPYAGYYRSIFEGKR